jgi:ribosomal protein S18 acetylase RimI-like enzyme
MQTCKILTGQEAELLALQKLAYQSEAKLYQDFNIPPLTQTLSELKLELEKSICLVCQDEGKVIASIRAYIDDGICKIGRLVVAPSHQRRGIGFKLMREIECYFKEAIVFEVFTGERSQSNIKLYNKLGYRESNTAQLSEKVTLVFLRKPNI